MQMTYENSPDSAIIQSKGDQDAVPARNFTDELVLTSELRYISMGIIDSTYYAGIRLYDENRNRLNLGSFDSSDIPEVIWSPLQAIPSDMHVIGFGANANTTVNAYRIAHVVFLLAKKGENKVSKEIAFPMYEVFPTKEQFDELYAPQGSATTEFASFKLSAISTQQYEQDGFGFAL